MNEVKTNEQKFKTPEERVRAFNAWCPRNDRNNIGCGSCKLKHYVCESSDCMAYWLALGAEEEKPEPCPFCGNDVTTSNLGEGIWYCKCSCGYKSKDYMSDNEAIAAHNRVCRAVEAAKKGATNA